MSSASMKLRGIIRCCRLLLLLSLSCMRVRCSLEHARSLSALSFPASLSLFQMTPFSTGGSSSSPLGFAIRKLETYTQVFFVLLCAPTGCSLAISFLFSLLFLLVCVALQLKSRSLLRYHTPRLCRIAVFSIQAIVLSDHDQWGLDSADSVSGGSSNHLHHRSDHVLCLPSSVAARPREMAIQSKPKPGAPKLLLATSTDVRPAPP